MLIAGLQGSPRKKGNTSYLLSLFMEEAEKRGAETKIVDVTRLDIRPCMEYIVCEKKGYCPIDDAMEQELLPLLRNADVIVAATPIFFYSCSAQLKAAIDRTQVLWARKYKLKLTDPNRSWRKGFLLALGATKGKNLFEGLHFTMKYFYDAVGAEDSGSITYRHIENPGDMEKHPSVQDEVVKAVTELIDPLLKRKKLLFLSRDDAGEGQIAAAYAQQAAGDRFEVLHCGIDPAAGIAPGIQAVMQADGIDLAYRWTHAVGSVSPGSMDVVVVMNDGIAAEAFNGSSLHQWDFPVLAALEESELTPHRDSIRSKIESLLEKI